MGIWQVIESFSDWFYEPLLFWSLPLLPAVFWEWWQHRHHDTTRRE